MLLLLGGLALLGLDQGGSAFAFLLRRGGAVYGELLLGLNYVLGLLALGLGVLLGGSPGGNSPQGLISLPERFGVLGSLAVGQLNLYFLLLTHGLLALTLLSFRQGALEERASLPLSAAAVLQRQRAQTLFGVLLAFLGLTLSVYFSCENLALFFLAFEASALPIFGVIIFYGKRSPKFRAAAYLLYFTLLSAAPLLGLLLVLYQRSGTLFYPELLALQHRGLLLEPGAETLLAFLAFFLPFGVKFAFFPLHSWLPEAHVEASTEGSMLLSGILLKLGFYGVVKCCLPLCGGALFGVAPALLSLALVGSLAGSLATYRQLDLKKIIAYSSVVHMNLSLVGYLSLSAVALQGALFMNFSHAVISAGLFSAVGLLQDRTRTRALPELSGLQTVMPLWSGALLLLLLANAGLPGTVGFVGEAALLWGCFGHYPYLGFLLLLPLTLMGLRSYLLYVQLCWGVTPAFLNPTPLAVPESAPALLRRWDLNPNREGSALLILTVLAVLLGLWPSFLLGLLEAAAVQPSLRWLRAGVDCFHPVFSNITVNDSGTAQLGFSGIVYGYLSGQNARALQAFPGRKGTRELLFPSKPPYIMPTRRPTAEDLCLVPGWKESFVDQWGGGLTRGFSITGQSWSGFQKALVRFNSGAFRGLGESYPEAVHQLQEGLVLPGLLRPLALWVLEKATTYNVAPSFSSGLQALEVGSSMVVGAVMPHFFVKGVQCFFVPRGIWGWLGHIVLSNPGLTCLILGGSVLLGGAFWFFTSGANDAPPPTQPASSSADAHAALFGEAFGDGFQEAYFLPEPVAVPNAAVNAAPADGAANAPADGAANAPADGAANAAVNAAPADGAANAPADGVANAPADGVANAMVNAAPADGAANAVVNAAPADGVANAVVNAAPADGVANAAVNAAPADGVANVVAEMDAVLNRVAAAIDRTIAVEQAVGIAVDAAARAAAAVTTAAMAAANVAAAVAFADAAAARAFAAHNLADLACLAYERTETAAKVAAERVNSLFAAAARGGSAARENNPGVTETIAEAAIRAMDAYAAVDAALETAKKPILADAAAHEVAANAIMAANEAAAASAGANFAANEAADFAEATLTVASRVIDEALVADLADDAADAAAAANAKKA